VAVAEAETGGPSAAPAAAGYGIGASSAKTTGREEPCCHLHSVTHKCLLHIVHSC